MEFGWAMAFLVALYLARRTLSAEDIQVRFTIYELEFAVACWTARPFLFMLMDIRHRISVHVHILSCEYSSRWPQKQSYTNSKQHLSKPNAPVVIPSSGNLNEVSPFHHRMSNIQR